MNKVLILASVSSMIDQFNMSNIEILRKKNYKIYIIANFKNGSNTSIERNNDFKKELVSMGITVYDIPINRNVLSFKNFKSYKIIRKIIRKENFKIIHCHSPIGGVLARLAAIKNRRTGTKVIYTAHGFHFFKGSPLKNWVLFFPIEYFLSFYTDVIITINSEDYKLAKKFFKAKNVEYIPGVGIDTTRFQIEYNKKLKKRNELSLSEDVIVILSVGELNKNKNHETIIKAISRANKTNIHYWICGKGNRKDYLNILIKKLKLEQQVKLLGYKEDLTNIYKLADIFAFPSKREGLGLAALEAMASGLPIVTSNIHGIKDYSFNEVTGFNCDYDDIESFKNNIIKLSNDKLLREKMAVNNINSVKKYDVSNVNLYMEKIYQDL